jgi:AcrR family transcriptional regulator
MVMTVPLNKGELSRQAILRTALEQSRKIGLEGLTIGSLADVLQRSKSGVFAHFGSREDLQLAVLEEGARQFIDEVFVPALKEKRGLPRLRALYRGWLKRMVDTKVGGCIFVEGAAEFGNGDGPVKEKISDLQLQWRKQLTKTVELTIEASPKCKADPEQIAFELFSLVLGVHHDARMFGTKDAMRLGEAAFERLVQVNHFTPT